MIGINHSYVQTGLAKVTSCILQLGGGGGHFIMAIIF